MLYITNSTADDIGVMLQVVKKSLVFFSNFREKIAYFTRAKISIPALPADDV